MKAGSQASKIADEQAVRPQTSLHEDSDLGGDRLMAFGDEDPEMGTGEWEELFGGPAEASGDRAQAEQDEVICEPCESFVSNTWRNPIKPSAKEVEDHYRTHLPYLIAIGAPFA